MIKYLHIEAISPPKLKLKVLYIKLRAMILHPCIQSIITSFLETTDLPFDSKAQKPDVDLKSRCWWAAYGSRSLGSRSPCSFLLPRLPGLRCSITSTLILPPPSSVLSNSELAWAPPYEPGHFPLF